jgi:F0F1-type ATP synthase membrane subunit b/b'
MAKNNKKNGVVELWGHQFKKAGEGLDKAEVESFVDDLMKKHEALLKRADHLSSLTKLAEKTIVEADSVAQQIQEEATNKAKDEAKAILASAEEQGQELIEAKRAEAQARANREAEDIKAKAQQQAEKLLEEKIKEIQPELKGNAKALYEELLTQLDNLKEQVVTLEKELDQRLSQPPEKTSAPEEPSKAAMEAEKEVEANKDEETEKAVEASKEEETEKAVETSKDEETVTADNEFLELIRPAEESDEAEPEWELEILPPIDLTQILDIINHLDGLAEVAQTELIPQIEQPTITVFLRQPIDLIEILETLPQVAQVTEVTTTSNGNVTKPRKAQIELSAKTAPKQIN